MDIALCSHTKGNNYLEYAGAYRPLIHVSGDIITKIRSTKRSIGGAQKIEKSDFVNNKIEIKKGDIFYAFSDGYADQFGGPKGRKFMMKNLLYELKNIQHLPMNEQGDYLKETIEIWMKNYDPIYNQVDDILLIGVQF
ncbi:MAG: SpoIIE family protein phosphatase, partial [Chlorobi bacterium]|nr:SpoIIE family protein phosphatase [Chlorobiota bacterium]